MDAQQAQAQIVHLLQALAALVAVSATLTGLLIWIFRTGRWTQKQEDDKGSLQKQFSEFKADIERHLAKVEKDVDDEDRARRAFVERVNTDLGRLEQRISSQERDSNKESGRVDRRFQALEKRVDDFQRQPR